MAIEPDGERSHLRRPGRSGGRRRACVDLARLDRRQLGPRHAETGDDRLRVAPGAALQQHAAGLGNGDKQRGAGIGVRRAGDNPAVALVEHLGEPAEEVVKGHGVPLVVGTEGEWARSGELFSLEEAARAYPVKL